MARKASRSRAISKPRSPKESSSSPYRSNRQASQELRDLRWFLLPLPGEEDADDKTVRHEVSARVWALSSRSRPQQRARHDMYLYHACLYDDSEMTGLTPGAYEAVTFEPSLLSFNVVRKMVDTCTARIAKNKPLPFPLTSGGDFMQQRRAKKFGRFIDGMFDTNKVWATSPMIARDATLWGTGLTHNYRVGRRLMHERVFPWEIEVDSREAQYGAPRTIRLRRYVDRMVLAERFPWAADKIAEAQETDDHDMSGSSGPLRTSDLVLVIETWHLPSGPLDKDGMLEPTEKDGERRPNDGRHAICISNCDLVYEEYKREYFPFCKLWMTAPLMGWFGNGMGKMLTGMQYTINDTAMQVQEQVRLSGGYVMVHDDADVATEQINNGPRTILRWNGNHEPSWINPQPMHPDQWRFVLDLIPQANAFTGVSEFASQSAVPRGMSNASGKALEMLSDEDSDRFALFSQYYEQYHIDVAWQMFDLAQEIVEEFGAYTVQSVTKERGKRILEKPDFAKVKLDRDAFVLQVYPTSMLPRSPAARIDYVQSLANAGWLSKEEAMMLLDFPDFEGFLNLSQAAKNIVALMLDKMLDAEDPTDPAAYTYPDPIENLQLAIVMTQEAYLNAIVEGADPKNLKLLRQFILDCRNENLKRNAQAAAASAPASTAPAGGAPAPIAGAPPPPTMQTPSMPAPAAAA